MTLNLKESVKAFTKSSNVWRSDRAVHNAAAAECVKNLINGGIKTPEPIGRFYQTIITWFNNQIEYTHLAQIDELKELIENMEKIIKKIAFTFAQNIINMFSNKVEKEFQSHDEPAINVNTPAIEMLKELDTILDYFLAYASYDSMSTSVSSSDSLDIYALRSSEGSMVCTARDKQALLILVAFVIQTPLRLTVKKVEESITNQTLDAKNLGDQKRQELFDNMTHCIGMDDITKQALQCSLMNKYSKLKDELSNAKNSKYALKQFPSESDFSANVEKLINGEQIKDIAEKTGLSIDRIRTIQKYLLFPGKLLTDMWKD